MRLPLPSLVYLFSVIIWVSNGKYCSVRVKNGKLAADDDCDNLHKNLVIRELDAKLALRDGMSSSLPTTNSPTNAVTTVQSTASAKLTTEAGSPAKTTKDVSDCDASNCSENANCTVVRESFTCQCGDGYIGDGLVECTDINECIEGTHDCHKDADCINEEGSFSCSCKSGFTGNGTFCEDNNECSEDTANCSIKAICSNTIGSFICKCNNGYTGDGIVCSDIDECSVDNGNCSENATCINTLGSFTCECHDGFAANGILCADIDECGNDTNNCTVNSACTNTAGSFYCDCKDGYIVNGSACSDINECVEKTHSCSVNASCTNTNGSFVCECNAGYSGDGVTCSVSVTSDSLVSARMTMAAPTRAKTTEEDVMVTTKVPADSTSTETTTLAATAADSCRVFFNGTCYWTYVEQYNNVKFARAEEICSSKTSIPAYFPNEEVYNKVVEDLHSNFPHVGDRLAVWTGITIDTNNGNVNHPSDKTYVTWSQGYPRTSTSEQTWTNVGIRLRSDHYFEGMFNWDPDDSWKGVVCQAK